MRIKSLVQAGFNAFHYVRQYASMKTGLNIGKPTNIYIAITHHCNFRCRMCHDWMIKTPELSHGQWLSALKKLFAWLPRGTKINFSGGEPLVLRFFPDLLKELHSEKHNWSRHLIGITSNGFFLDESVAAAMMKLDLFNINVSLDSLDGRKHDELRGKKGAFERLLNAIDSLTRQKKRYNAHTTLILKTVISGANLHELADIIRFARDKHISGVYFQPIEQTFGDKPDKNWYKKSELWPDNMSDVKTVLKEVGRLKDEGYPVLNSGIHLNSMIDYFHNPLRKNSRMCPLGYSTMFIYPDGTMFLCPAFGGIGNLSSGNIEEIWKSKKADKKRASMKKCSKQCLLTCLYQSGLHEKARAFLGLMKNA
ncbi:MAG: radical SAM protein [Spirochaetales bacterium]|nr:radical SAM protein [Spirochaetales bacterium]